VLACAWSHLCTAAPPPPPPTRACAAWAGDEAGGDAPSASWGATDQSSDGGAAAAVGGGVKPGALGHIATMADDVEGEGGGARVSRSGRKPGAHAAGAPAGMPDDALSRGSRGSGGGSHEEEGDGDGEEDVARHRDLATALADVEAEEAEGDLEGWMYGESVDDQATAFLRRAARVHAASLSSSGGRRTRNGTGGAPAVGPSTMFADALALQPGAVARLMTVVAEAAAMDGDVTAPLHGSASHLAAADATARLTESAGGAAAGSGMGAMAGVAGSDVPRHSGAAASLSTVAQWDIASRTGVVNVVLADAERYGRLPPSIAGVLKEVSLRGKVLGRQHAALPQVPTAEAGRVPGALASSASAPALFASAVPHSTASRHPRPLGPSAVAAAPSPPPFPARAPSALLDAAPGVAPVVPAPGSLPPRPTLVGPAPPPAAGGIVAAPTALAALASVSSVGSAASSQAAPSLTGLRGAGPRIDTPTASAWLPPSPSASLADIAAGGLGAWDADFGRTPPRPARGQPSAAPANARLQPIPSRPPPHVTPAAVAAGPSVGIAALPVPHPRPDATAPSTLGARPASRGHTPAASARGGGSSMVAPLQPVVASLPEGRGATPLLVGSLPPPRSMHHSASMPAFSGGGAGGALGHAPSLLAPSPSLASLVAAHASDRVAAGIATASGHRVPAALPAVVTSTYGRLLPAPASLAAADRTTTTLAAEVDAAAAAVTAARREMRAARKAAAGTGVGTLASTTDPVAIAAAAARVPVTRSTKAGGKGQRRLLAAIVAGYTE
jgi:hypothetical protein